MTTAPGWYVDPLGLWDLRWWDGVAWSEAVRTGTHQDSDPVVPIVAIAAATPPNGVVWQSKRAVDAVGAEHYVLTGSALSIYKQLNQPPTTVWPLWTIGHASARVNGGQSLLNVGDVVVTIAYEGYAGRSTGVLKNISDPHHGAAWIYRFARLARRAAGVAEPALPKL